MKAPVERGIRSQRHAPLEDQMVEQQYGRLRQKARQKAVGRERRRNAKKEEAERMQSGIGEKILREARLQREEEGHELGLAAEEIGHDDDVFVPIPIGNEEEPDYDFLEDNQDTLYEELQLDEDDERALALFAHEPTTRTLNLGELIWQKIQQQEEEAGVDTETLMERKFDRKIIEVYKGVGQILQRYRAGKLPKPFKILPQLEDWEELLWITEPHRWSPAAVFQATKIFISTLTLPLCQRFCYLVLLPRIRDNIQDHKRLNFYLYQCLRKALYKPSAFFKGILIPLCQYGDCTLRESVIIGSVLSKVSIPMIHVAATLLQLCEMPYDAATSMFIRYLVNKKYSLPKRVIDSLVIHFDNFKHEKRDLPVLWHQCFLTFAQRYKDSISPEQKAQLKEVMRLHFHKQITPEIRRELFNNRTATVTSAMKQ